MSERTGKCVNCETHSYFLNDRDYCLECADAFDAGYRQALIEREGAL